MIRDRFQCKSDKCHSLNDLYQAEIRGPSFDHCVHELVAKELEAALALLGSRAPSVKHLLDIVMHTFFLAESNSVEGLSAYGASTSNLIGLIWISSFGMLSIEDYAELLLHELTHHLLFIDEHVHPYFDEEALHSKKTWCYSAILRRARPLDKAFHSIVVASELLLARERFLPPPSWIKVHPSTEALSASLNQSIQEFESFRSLGFISARAWALFDRCQEKTASIRKVPSRAAA